MKAQENRHKNLWIAHVLGVTGEIWLLVYAGFRVWTVWYSWGMAERAIDKIVIIMFVVAEMFILMQGLGYIANSLRAMRRYRRKEVVYDMHNVPEVEVLIPSFEEPPEILTKAVVAAKLMDYPSFKIKILDDSEDKKAIENTKRVANELGVEYVQQPYPRHGAKAGNLNDYLKTTKVKYIAIFDADYRPSRDFLKLVVPQLEENKNIAYVQTPQFYSNTEYSVISKAAQSVQSIFFEYICEGKAIQNAIFLCGTNFVVRTEHLKKIGGFEEDTVTEDFSTSIKLCQHKFDTAYYSMVLAFGEGPITLEDYFKQQYRWARGTIEVFFKNLKIMVFGKDMSLGQKIEFFLSGNYYFVGMAWLMMISVPPLFLLFGIPVYFANPYFYFGAYLPYFIFSLLFYLQTLTTRHYPNRNMMLSQSLTILTLPVYARAAIDAIFRRKSKFVVTRKDTNRREYSIPWGLMKTQLFLVYANIFAIWIGFLQIGIVENPIAVIINIVWATFHVFILTYLPLLVLIERKQWKTKFS